MTSSTVVDPIADGIAVERILSRDSDGNEVVELRLVVGNLSAPLPLDSAALLLEVLYGVLIDGAPELTAIIDWGNDPARSLPPAFDQWRRS